MGGGVVKAKCGLIKGPTLVADNNTGLTRALVNGLVTQCKDALVTRLCCYRIRLDLYHDGIGQNVRNVEINERFLAGSW